VRKDLDGVHQAEGLIPENKGFPLPAFARTGFARMTQYFDEVFSKLPESAG
jgi:hypothetical protein